MKGFISFIVTLLVVGLIGGIIAITYKYTDGFSSDFKTFYLVHDGKEILTPETKVAFVGGKKYKYEVKYVFENGKDEKKGFTVKVLPNAEKDFEYTVAENKYKYSGLKDITTAFDIKLAEDSFEINIPENFGIKDVVKFMHGGQEVTFSDGATVDMAYPFKLEVTSYNGAAKYTILFNIVSTAGVTGVTLDPTEIVFGT